MKHSIKNILNSYNYKIVGQTYEPIKEIIGYNNKDDLYICLNITEEDIHYYYVDEYGDECSTIILTTENIKLKNDLLERIYYEKD